MEKKCEDVFYCQELNSLKLLDVIMKVQDLQEIVKLMENSGIAELSLEEENLKLSLTYLKKMFMNQKNSLMKKSFNKPKPNITLKSLKI